MRNAFIHYITTYAQSHPELILLTADMGFSVFEEFRDLYPNQFYNVGIAEATMTGVAAGLALQQYSPIIYSIIPFVTMRNLEQIRVDVCYQNLPVIMVGVGGGFSYGALGSTHHAIEDISLMRSLPNMQVLVPSDPMEAQSCLQYAIESGRPTYIRLGKNNEPRLHAEAPNLYDGVFLLRKGENVAIVGVGTIINEILAAGEILSQKGYEVAIFSMPMVKPLSYKAIERIFSQYRQVVIIEEHLINGGAGTAVLEALHDQGGGLERRLYRIGLPEEYPTTYGSQSYLLSHYGLDRDHLFSKILSIINNVDDLGSF